jgi:phage gpG-like protein
VVRVKRIKIEISRLISPELRQATGTFLEQQVKKRFATQGLSGGMRWLPKRIKDGRAILTGRTGALLNSFFAVSMFRKSTSTNEIAIGSSLPYAKVHQLGTVGKGGILPSIFPRKAKALWIPLNDRAARLGTYSQGLVHGRDFVFAKKVDIPPRPMLPDSKAEKQDQEAFVKDYLSRVRAK